MLTDQDHMIMGLARTLTKLAVMLTEQGALDAAQTVSGFRDYASQMRDDPTDEHTKMWSTYIADVLEYDPTSGSPSPKLTIIQGGVS